MNDKIYENTNKLSISIMGDSISTFKGFNPYGYAVYYNEDVAYENELSSVNDTWWMQVIGGLGGKLSLNNSYSGSFVAGEYQTSACSKNRCAFLDNGAKPDVILVYMGTNDRGYALDIKPDEPDNTQYFYGGYKTMLKRIKANYPSAKVICATLLIAYKKGYENIAASPTILEHSKKYNQAIRRAVQEENCLLADIAAFGERYQTLDYAHPTKIGHNTMAKLWLESIKKYF